MAEYNYKDVKKFFKESKNAPLSPVYLIHGEEFLYKSVFDELIRFLLGDKKGLNYEPFEDSDGIGDVIERLNTYSFLSGTKVVAMRGSRIFDSSRNVDALLQKAKAHYEKEEPKKASGLFLSVLSHMNLGFDELAPENRGKIKNDLLKSEEEKWVDGLTLYCVENRLVIPAAADNAKLLEKHMEKGFAKGNHLVITTDGVDKRKSLYKLIKKIGVIIDCSAPKGERKADREAQEKLLRETMTPLLSKARKKIEPAAFNAVTRMTGFDLRTFAANLEKLISYCGDRAVITSEDVHKVLKRTKTDPIFELSSAVAERDLAKSLFYCDSLLAGGFFSLQILATLINQVRRLILVKDFTESPEGRSSWFKGCPFNRFRDQVMPSIKAYDKGIAALVEEWDGALNPTPEKGKKKKKKSATDLVVAKNPGSPYPVYMALQNSERYTRDELLNAFEILGEADIRLKSSGMDHKLVLEEAIIRICRRNTP